MQALALCLVLPSLIAAYPSIANLPKSPCPAHTVICADGDGLSSRYLKCVQGSWVEAFCPTTHLCVGSKGPTVFCAAPEPMSAVATTVERLSKGRKPLPNASSLIYLHQSTPAVPQQTPVVARVPLLAPVEHPVSVPPLDLARSQGPIWMLPNAQSPGGESSVPGQGNLPVQRPAIDLARSTGPVWLFGGDTSPLDGTAESAQAAADSAQFSAPAQQPDSAIARPSSPGFLNSASRTDEEEAVPDEPQQPRVPHQLLESSQQLPESTQLGGMDADKVMSVIASFIILHSSERANMPSNAIASQPDSHHSGHLNVVTATEFVTAPMPQTAATAHAPVSSTPNIITVSPVAVPSLQPTTMQMQSSLPPLTRTSFSAAIPTHLPQNTPVAPMVVPASPASSARATSTQSPARQNVIPYIPFRVPRSCRPGEFLCEAHGLRPGFFACDAGGLALPAACSINEVCYQYGRSILCDAPGGTIRNP